MANTVSAAKNARKANRRHIQRVGVKSELKTLRKKTLLAAASQKPAEEIQQLARVTFKKFDQAAAHGYIHRKTASRKIGRLMKSLYKSAQQKLSA